MLTPEETARRHRINKILLPVGALIVIAIVVMIVAVSCSSTGDQTTPEDMKAAPEMTDEEYAQFRDKALAIDPNLSEDHLRNDARDSCSGIDGDNAVSNVSTRFSRDGNAVNEDEAQELVDLIRDVGFCAR